MSKTVHSKKRHVSRLKDREAKQRQMMQRAPQLADLEGLPSRVPTRVFRTRVEA